MVNSELYPLGDVSALDDQDDDLTDEISLVIFKDSAIVSEVDTTEERSYSLVYTIRGTAGNEAEFVTILEIIVM